MIRKLLQSALCLTLCPLLVGEQVDQQTAQSSPDQASKATQPKVTIPKNTVIELDALEPVATATLGSNIRLAVVNDVRIKGVIAIRARSPVTGIIAGSKRGAHSMTWNGITSIRARELESGQPIRVHLEGIDAHENQMAVRDSVDPKKLLLSGAALGFLLLVFLKAEVK
jgi:hypothetical protein